MGAVDSDDLQRIVLYKSFADVDKQLHILWGRRLAVALAGQLDILALVPLDDRLVIESLGVCQIYHEPDFDLVGLHRVEQHVGVKAMLGRDLIIVSLIQRRFERKESASH